MGKNSFFLIAFLCAGSFVSAAKADSYAYSPYAGLDYIRADAHAKGNTPHYNAGGLHIGSHYGKYFGTELFFNQSDGDTRKTAAGEVKTSRRAYGLDLMAYLPLGRFAFIGTAGAGEYVFKVSRKPRGHNNESANAYRFGGGLKYDIGGNFDIRTIVRYVNFDKLSACDHAVEYSAGIEYNF